MYPHAWTLTLLLCALLNFPTANASDNVVQLDGYSFRNKGLVAFGTIPSNFRESIGDTLGGFGSAIAIKPGTWKKNKVKGRKNQYTYTGTMVVHPDRGYNVETTIDYQARQQEIDFKLNPYYEDEDLSYEDAQETLKLKYKSTLMKTEITGASTTGLDALAVRPETKGFFFEFPALPVSQDNRLSLDVEGLVANPDGSFWISDEYGPYIYRFSSKGKLKSAIQPPEAFLPKDIHGNLNFTSTEEPLITVSGRSPNQGFEGLTMDTETETLYAILQSATVQDGGPEKETARYTRMVAYDVSRRQPQLVGEYVVPLPVSKKGKARGCSEIHFLGDGIFLALSRDGDGHGSDEIDSSHKQADLFSINHATDIHGSKYDDPANPVSPGGQLVQEIEPAEFVSFVDYLDKDGLKKFGLHNGDPDDNTNIAAKWESLALAPVDDSDNPDDYFLFTVADNDYLTTDGMMLGQSYDAGIDVDSQFFVFRVSLPVVNGYELKKALSIAL